MCKHTGSTNINNYSWRKGSCGQEKPAKNNRAWHEQSPMKHTDWCSCTYYYFLNAYIHMSHISFSCVFLCCFEKNCSFSKTTTIKLSNGKRTKLFKSKLYEPNECKQISIVYINCLNDNETSQKKTNNIFQIKTKTNKKPTTKRLLLTKYNVNKSFLFQKY